MKKIVSLVLSLVLLMSVGVTVFADDGLQKNEVQSVRQTMTQDHENGSQTVDPQSVELVYRHQINQIMTDNYYNTFSVPKKGVLPFKRKVYLSGGAKFADGVARNITVTVGDKKFTIWADGTVELRGNVSVSTEMPVMISVEGIDSKCIVVFDVYTLD